MPDGLAQIAECRHNVIVSRCGAMQHAGPRHVVCTHDVIRCSAFLRSTHIPRKRLAQGLRCLTYGRADPSALLLRHSHRSQIRPSQIRSLHHSGECSLRSNRLSAMQNPFALPVRSITWTLRSLNNWCLHWWAVIVLQLRAMVRNNTRRDGSFR